MSETALAATYKALRTALTGGSESWATRAYPDIAPEGVARPYVVFGWAGGGEANEVRRQDASLIISVKVVADTMTASMAGAVRLSELLNDQGEQESNTITGGTFWEISTITQERAVHLVEQFGNAKPIYHDGHIFRFRLEAK